MSLRNEVNLIGRIANDCQLLNSQGNIAYSRNSIAISKKNKNGEYESDFYKFVVFGKTAEFMINYIAKGDLVKLKGHLTNNTLTNNENKKVNVIELIADDFDILAKAQAKQNNNYQKQESMPFPETNNFDIKDDDLPF